MCEVFVLNLTKAVKQLRCDITSVYPLMTLLCAVFLFWSWLKQSNSWGVTTDWSCQEPLFRTTSLTSGLCLTSWCPASSAQRSSFSVDTDVLFCRVEMPKVPPRNKKQVFTAWSFGQSGFSVSLLLCTCMPQDAWGLARVVAYKIDTEWNNWNLNTLIDCSHSCTCRCEKISNTKPSG